MSQPDIKQRLEALSPNKRRLLALRLGIDTATNQHAESQNTTLAAFVKADGSVEPDTLRNYLADQLPKYMIPSSIVLVDDIPRTPNGKVDREALLTYRQSEAELVAVDGTESEPDDIEQELIAMWEDLLGIEVYSVDDDFFELGGYSLLAIRMLAQINERFGKELPPSSILEAPTIAALAEQIRDDADNLASQTIFTLQPDGEKPPIYFFQVHKYGVITYRYMAEHLGKERPLYGISLPQDLEEQPDTIEGLAELFAKSIQAHHEPPYYLGGMSIAGLLAYETARQLQKQGVDDCHVLLFDTYGPDYPRMIPVREALTQRLQAHMQALTNSDTDTVWYLRELLWRNWYRASFQLRRNLSRYLVRLSIIEESKQAQEGYVEGEEMREWAGQKVYGEMIELLELEERYFEDAKPFSGVLTLYRSTLQPVRAAYSKTLGWDNLVTGRINVRHVRGNHSGIMRFPFVQKLAETVNQDLRQLEQSSS